MSPEQKDWLQSHPAYSPVRYAPISLTQWADQGYLWANGKFSIDDRQTLFPHEYAWSGVKANGALRVGRHYVVV